MEDQFKEVSGMIDAILNIRVAMKQYVQRKIREDNIDLTYEMVQVLAVLWRKGNINQQEIADRVQKNKASLTSLLDNLAKRNLIIRREDPSDRRNKIIILTEAGKAHEGPLASLLKGFYENLGKDIPIEEMNKITGMLKNMETNLLI